MTTARGLTRRHLLGIGVAGAGLAVSGVARAASCALTPAQTAGPFYPQITGDVDWDLTRLGGAPGRAEGEVIEITGRVLDTACRPIAGAAIDVWQANRSGRYDHPLDSGNANLLDANFQGFARIQTDADGAYRILTIRPGSYPATANWVRPPHIHYMAHAEGRELLTTQMYFAGDPLNDADRIFGSLSPAERSRVAVAFDQRRADGIATGTFDLIVG